MDDGDRPFLDDSSTRMLLVDKAGEAGDDSDTDSTLLVPDQGGIQDEPLLEGGGEEGPGREDHCHLEAKPSDRRAVMQLIAVSVLCFIFMIAEIVGGLLANSLAIATDATHMASDLAGFLISLFAIWMARKPATSRMSFGYYRAEVLGALVSVLIIWVVTGVLVYLAVLRVKDTEYAVKPLPMLITASVGIGFNIVMGLVLHGKICKGCNVHSSFGHGHSHGGGGSHSHGGGGSHSHGGGGSHSHGGGGSHSHGGGGSHSHGGGGSHSHGGGGGYFHIAGGHGNGLSVEPNQNHSIQNHSHVHSASNHSHAHAAENHCSHNHASHDHTPHDHTSNDHTSHDHTTHQSGPLNHHQLSLDDADDAQTAATLSLTGSDSSLLFSDPTAETLLLPRIAVAPLEPRSGPVGAGGGGRDAVNINVRAAMVHVIGDLIQSLGVFVAALIIMLQPSYKIADPICTFIFSFLVMCTTFNVLWDIVIILMQGVPRDLNYASMKKDLEDLAGVKAVHSLNVWSLTMDKVAVGVHLAVGPSAAWQPTLAASTALLRHKYNAQQTTIQVERYDADAMTSCDMCRLP